MEGHRDGVRKGNVGFYSIMHQIRGGVKSSTDSETRVNRMPILLSACGAW